MANTLNIEERTLEQVRDSTDNINTINEVAGRSSAYQPKVVRITDHEGNDAGETGADTDKMAIFVSQRIGEPWVLGGSRDMAVKHIILKDGDAPDVGATVIFPDFDYTTFE
tara:strand:- start:841 stop:1173 length:333 start_codon:yes stop_codon:yes gene_type:complete